MPTVTTYSPLIPPDKALEQHRSKGRRSSIRAGSPRHLVDVTAADLHAMSLSPPPTPISPMTPMPSTGSKGGKFSPHRLRSNSGLALHTNDDILKQYTDYYPDGTPRISVGLDGTGSLGFMSETRRSSVAVSEAESHTEPPVPSLAGRETFDMVMKNPETANKLWKFADSQGCGHHIEFLAKVAIPMSQLETPELTIVDSRLHGVITASCGSGLSHINYIHVRHCDRADRASGAGVEDTEFEHKTTRQVHDAWPGQRVP